jgi:hypothetical protein
MISPVCGLIILAIAASKVNFSDPLGPMRAKISSRRSSSETLLSAAVSP